MTDQDTAILSPSNKTERIFKHANKQKSARPKPRTEKRKPRLSPNKSQVMIGFPHNNLTEFALLPNSHSYCVQKGYTIPLIWKDTIIILYEICLATNIVAYRTQKIKCFRKNTKD